jgi:TATA-box binding protein (TBP) (component of TFIID and TFIIIB)
MLLCQSPLYGNSHPGGYSCKRPQTPNLQIPRASSISPIGMNDTKCSYTAKKRRRRRIKRPDSCGNDFVSRMKEHGDADGLFEKTANDYFWAQNTVTVVWIGKNVHLRDFSVKRFNTYVPPRFEACTVRFKNQDTSTGLLFKTGATVVAGTRSIPQTYQAAHRLRMALEEDGKTTTFSHFSLVNMVYNAEVDLGCGIDIANMHVNNQGRSKYVPTVFPGEKLDVAEGLAKVSVFDTCKYVMMGVKNRREVKRIKNEVNVMVMKYRDPNLPESNKRFEYRKKRKREVSENAARRTWLGNV